jgi:hypothetical protein
VRTRMSVSASILFFVTLGLAGVAAADCNPGRPSGTSPNNFHVGAYTSYTSACLTGSSANILVTSPWVHSGDFSTAYVMLAGTAYYGQVGWLKHDGQVWDFWEVHDSSGIYENEWGHPTIHNSPEYKVTFSSSAFHFFKNGTVIHTQTETGYSGCDSQQMGEISNYRSQMPGTVGYHVVYQNASVRDSSAIWHDAEGVQSNDDSTAWGVTTPNSHRIEIWDKACN